MANLLVRPLLIPAAVAAGGLWYGSYDVTVKALSFFAPSSFSKHSDRLRTNAFCMGVFSGAAVGYGRMVLFPPPAPKAAAAEPPPAGTAAAVRDTVRRLVTTVKTFPVRYHCVTLIGAGVVSGVTSTAVRVFSHG